MPRSLPAVVVRSARALTRASLALLVCSALAAGARAEIPPPPGGPLLVVTNSDDPFTLVPTEILRTEGFAAFDVVALGDLTPALLAAHDVAWLGPMGVTSAQQQMFADWVGEGGALIAMRPDPRLGTLLGLHRSSGSLSERYLQVNTRGGAGAGIPGDPMQFHGTADLWTLDGATAVATLESGPGVPSSYVAVSQRTVGARGGQAIAFAYDLARSVVETRQGNPAWAGQERDGLPPRRSDDLFVGAAAADPQADWVDHSRIDIPQADLQQRLLANLITAAALHREPLPRFWYFPGGPKAVVKMTGDDHAHGGTLGRFELERAVSPAGCSAPDWQCVRSSSYVYPGTPISDSAAVAATADGFEIGLHYTTSCQDWPSTAWLDSSMTAQLGALAAQLPSMPAPSTNRTHCVAWSDWASEARAEAAHGIRLDCTYYYWPNSFVAGTPGYFTGSGIPMRFADLDGSLIDVYQAPTQMPDESQMIIPTHINALLDAALGPKGYYAALVANMHTDSVAHYQWAEIVAAAQLRGVPVVSGRQLLAWLDARGRSRYQDVSWRGDTLRFAVVADPAARHLSVLVPAQSSDGALLTIELDGVPVAFATMQVAGVTYARFECAGGAVAALYQADVTPPQVSGLFVLVDDEGEATVTWETDEPADSRLDLGLTSSSLDHSVSSPSRVSHHSLRIEGVAPDTLVWLRVRSADAAGYSTTWPSPPAPPFSVSTASHACAHDGTALDFGAGAPDAGGFCARHEGVVSLRPAFVEEFADSTLPTGWQVSPAEAAAGATCGPEGLALEGVTAIAPRALLPGDAAEAVARLAGPGSSLGLVGPADRMVAAFVVLGDGTLAAVTHGDGGEDTTRLAPADTLAHRYRVTRDTSSVRFAIEGVTAAVHGRAIDGELHFAATDPAADGVSMRLGSVIATPYASHGAFVSRVFDATQLTPWTAAQWEAEVTAGATLALSVRGGSTSQPDAGWAAFRPLSGNGGNPGVSARYVQYRVEFTSSDAHLTPMLRGVALRCSPLAPQTSGVVVPPRVTALSAAIPNPTRGRAELRLELAASGAVEAAVYSIDGRRVSTLASGWRPAGVTTLVWDGRDDAGHESGSGVYLVRFAGGGMRLTRRVVRVR